MTCDAWPVTFPCPTDDLDPALVDVAVEAATELLWALSGRRLGVCTYTESLWPPCAGACGMPYKDPTGAWRNRGGAHNCCRLLLAHRPIVSVSAVVVEGVPLDAAAYRFDASYLRRWCACWPCGDPCCDAPVLVEYTAGWPLPATTDIAVGEVACEYLAALSGGVCRLPSRITSMTRQGISIELAPVDAASARLGLPIADAWLAAVNGRSSPEVASRVYSPDLARSSS